MNSVVYGWMRHCDRWPFLRGTELWRRRLPACTEQGRRTVPLQYMERCASASELCAAAGTEAGVRQICRSAARTDECMARIGRLRGWSPAHLSASAQVSKGVGALWRWEFSVGKSCKLCKCGGHFFKTQEKVGRWLGKFGQSHIRMGKEHLKQRIHVRIFDAQQKHHRKNDAEIGVSPRPMSPIRENSAIPSAAVRTASATQKPMAISAAFLESCFQLIA